jgi:hypothetical protein
MDWVGVRRTCCLFVMLVICNYFYNEEHFANIECHNWRQSLAEIDIILQGFLAWPFPNALGIYSPQDFRVNLQGVKF